MKRKLRKSFARPLINYLSDMVLKDIVPEGKEIDEGPRDYNKKVDSAEAFKYRRKDDDDRQADYKLCRQIGMSVEEARAARDLGHDHVMDLVRHKDMPYYGFSPEWTESILGPEKAREQVQGMNRAYVKAGIPERYGEELPSPEHARRLNEELKVEGKPLIEVPDEHKHRAAREYKKIEERQPMRKSKEDVGAAFDERQPDIHTGDARTNNLIRRNVGKVGRMSRDLHDPEQNADKYNRQGRMQPIANSMRKAQVPDHGSIKSKINRLAKLAKTGGDPSTIRALQSEIQIYNIKNPVAPPSEAERNIRITPNQDKSALMTKSLINRINKFIKSH